MGQRDGDGGRDLLPLAVPRRDGGEGGRLGLGAAKTRCRSTITRMNSPSAAKVRPIPKALMTNP
jgi:hypothetical protein